MSRGYHPGKFKLSKDKLNELLKILSLSDEDMKKVMKNKKNIQNTLKHGDMQPALVMATDPLLIAIYTDEFDAVLIYEFPSILTSKYHLQKGEKMVCCNSYWPLYSFDVEPDIIPGTECTNKYRDVINFIPLFLCKLNQEKFCYQYVNFLDPKYWERLDELLKEYQEQKPNQYRFGFRSMINY